MLTRRTKLAHLGITGIPVGRFKNRSIRRRNLFPAASRATRSALIALSSIANRALLITDRRRLSNPSDSFSVSHFAPKRPSPVSQVAVLKESRTRFDKSEIIRDLLDRSLNVYRLIPRTHFSIFLPRSFPRFFPSICKFCADALANFFTILPYQAPIFSRTHAKASRCTTHDALREQTTCGEYRKAIFKLRSAMAIRDSNPIN